MDFPSGLKILTVDDSSTIRKLVLSFLQSFNFNNIEQAEDGKMAWGKIDQAVNDKSPYELIICDWSMPNMTGLELLKKIRDDDRIKETMFIMLTSEINRSNVMDALQAGVNNYVSKPLDKKIFEEKIAKVLEKSYKG